MLCQCLSFPRVPVSQLNIHVHRNQAPLSPADNKAAQQQLWQPSHPEHIHRVCARQWSIPLLSIFEKYF